MADTICTTRRTFLKAGLGAMAALAAGCDGRRAGPAAGGLHEFRGPTMGSTYTVKIVEPGLSAAGRAQAHAAVLAALERVEGRMSTYRPDSELSRLNRHAEAAPVALSAETLAVFAAAQRVSEASGGAFDVTVGPVVDAWGFGPSKLHAVPPEDEIRRLGARVGHRMLEVDERSGTVAKRHPDIRADLSGIAKGYGVDAAARALEQLGFGHYMVEAGGEVRTRGLNAVGEPWRVGIERPDAVPQRVHLVVPLSGLSMATSGDYRIFFEQDGRRYSHEIDPAIGAPVMHRLASVSVVHADCVLADAWSTALFVLGPEKGPLQAEAQGLAAHFIVRESGGGFLDRRSPAFAALGGHPARG
ncbi:MAG TPA: FAD:protein FMN transferase [Burkholderiales bacterium]|nr:FAD:protein FMN transferase [Burkholderiales bacterium]